MNAARVQSTSRRYLAACLSAFVAAFAGLAFANPAPAAAANCFLIIFCAKPAAPAPAPTPPPALPRFFDPGGVWNAALSPSAALTPDSDSLVATLRYAVQHWGAWINTTAYSAPVYVVPANLATSRVALRNGGPPGMADQLSAVPLPAGTRPADGTDQQLVVYQPSTDTMWEFWQLRWTSTGWVTGYGGRMRPVSTNTGIFPTGFGATVTSLPLLGGMMTINELQAGRIDHALAFAMPYPRAGVFVWPAQRTDGDGPASSVPEGTRFRLPANLDIAALNLPPMTAMIAKAVQRYGMILRDKGGSFAFYGQDPRTYTQAGLPDPYTAMYGGLRPDQLLASFPWDKLQAIQPHG
ncbi:MAG: hypothetical protein JWN32_52 [Solirubrobacterales bacterium]|nr:hypothetical protein [Solirubrobacterales bacterium]